MADLQLTRLRLRRVLPLAALCLLFPVAAAGQAAGPTVSPLTRVRVSAGRGGPGTLVGYLAAGAADSLRLTTEPDLARVVLPWRLVERLEVSDGRHGRARLGALLGALAVGAGAAGVVSVACFTGTGCYVSGDAGAAVLLVPVVGALGGAVLGAGVGALVGSAFHHERWREVPLRRLRPGMGSRPRGAMSFGFALALPGPRSE